MVDSNIILITGGAGYIGSHTAHLLLDRGRKIVVVDNLATGHRWAVPKAVSFVEGDIGDYDFMLSLLKQHGVKSVLHFAASTEVEESVYDPMKYYRNNVTGSLNLVEACLTAGVKHFIFSSTCAVYGDAGTVPVSESSSTVPMNPYGKSKLMTEWMLNDLSMSSPEAMTSVSLRYFNVAGASVEKGIGQASSKATQLIKVACEVAIGKRPQLNIFGTDYPTEDGTCIRDYMHVSDLAETHLLALEYLENGGSPDTFNCGYGVGYSVKQVVEAVKNVSGVDFPIVISDRRPGDSIAIYADITKIRRILGWVPKCNKLSEICKTSFDWEVMLQNRNQEKKG